MIRDVAPTTTVRVHQHTRRAITKLCARRGINAAELLEELVARERDSALLAAMNEHFAGPGADQGAFAGELEAWEEQTLLDGLSRPL
jgi:hypothetical protein